MARYLILIYENEKAYMDPAPEVWQTLEAAVSRSPVKGIILERDEQLPPFAELLVELEQARSIGRRHGRWP